ncbi:MAG: ABC transporter substrate-binding protein [Desulfovibrionaceae bacterium]|jgi:hypothetical protein|nr:ABC transporter substrate-binding protein [Desulfovibrionaceae bacterium]
MTQNLNPFARGYQNLHTVRTLLITFDDDCPPVWRPLHPTQAHLSDRVIENFPCLHNKDFALITVGQDVPDELVNQCPAEGLVRAVVYAIEAEDCDGQPAHLGDFSSAEAARDVIHQLRFETGFYSRCWEINSAHLTLEAWHWLHKQASGAPPHSFLFVPFLFNAPDSQAIGVKLISTPWTDEVLSAAEGIDGAWRLHDEHRRAGMPECLLEILRLAALADVRMLVFDADAPLLGGLAQAMPA